MDHAVTLFILTECLKQYSWCVSSIRLV